MLRCSLVGVVVALAALSVAPAQEKVAAAEGAGTTLLHRDRGEQGRARIIKQVGPTKGEFSTTLEYKPAFKDIDASDPKGKKLTADEVAKRLKPGTVVLVSVDEKPVDPVYLSIVKDDTVILAGVVVRAEAVPIKPKK